MADDHHDDTHEAPDHAESYPRFLLRCLFVATEGRPVYYAWMGTLTLVCLVGLYAFGVQTRDGMGVTALSDHVSWGMYIANLTYVVGLAAGGVMMVIPAYLYHDRHMHKVVLTGEILAAASILMALAFVIVDLGRPDRFWHIIPGIGRFNWPMSMLTWDVIVLGGYLLINAHVVGYLLYSRFIGVTPSRRWYLPMVFLSIVWAISIHTVTAFLYSGLGGRPFWNTAILAPRFLASAFVTGPAVIILTLHIVEKMTDFVVGEGPTRTLVAIMRVTVLVNIFMVLAEVFTQFYTGGSHSIAAEYLYFGVGEHDALVPWIWTAMGFNGVAAVILVFSGVKHHLPRILVACVLSIVGIWIEKGMGLIIPGFVPSTLHEFVEYMPNRFEWAITAAIWAFGAMIYTIGAKVSVAVYSGEEHDEIPAETGAAA